MRAVSNRSNAVVPGKAGERELGGEPVSLESNAKGLAGEILLSTVMDRKGEQIKDTLDLRANEGVIIGAPAHKE